MLDDLRLSLPDVAELAHVRRPVVSVWRRRHADGPRPFPAPVSQRGGSPRFRASDVVDWVEATGLGNNAAFRADVALRAALDDAMGPPDDVALGGLTALLRLKAYVDEPLGTLAPEDVLDLADELDPDDDAVFTEVDALGEHLEMFCTLADLAAGSAYHPGAAVEALLADRFRTGRSRLTRSALAASAVALVADVVGALLLGAASQAGTSDHAPLADPYPGCGDLLAAVLGRDDLLDTPTALVPVGNEHRLVRRRLGAHGWSVRAPRAEGEPALVVTQVPPVGAGPLDDAAVLAMVDDVVLDLAPGQRALVVGPASALVAATSSREAESARSALLRTDRLRAAVLLPAGLVVERPRERVALWVLGDAHPEVPIADRWTMVADLSGVVPVGGRFPRAVVDDLCTDVLAALGTADDVARHAFRFARFVPARHVLASGGSLVAAARPIASGARDDAVAAAVRAGELVALLDAAPRPPLDVRVERGPAAPVRRVPLGALVERGIVRRVPGNRLDVADVRGSGDVPTGEVRVLGVPELCGETEPGERVVDRMTFAARYPAGRLTEPGDVVYTTTPRPAALVDEEGFSVVAWPARVLRLGSREPEDAPGAVGQDGRVVAEVLAPDVAAQARGTRWPSWEVRVVPADQADDVAAALARVRTGEVRARRELAHLAELATTLADGVTTGVVRMRKDGPGS
ncbi:hypothetical protein [Cellulosimicrobium arenosum]|uniref:DNA-binding protein n=1 Tax=Cellulosimicrobium arenosum TaxID=2708133 RepID=A0A927IZD8_9MICO|nr:hypothetical protein [Cellulosimicrobium arenosum]MBD8078172.1 hypothetical protein [Cellulosimicrobium arenosum]